MNSDKESTCLFFPEYPTSLSMRIDKFENSSEYKKFIKSCEKIIRSSIEYREWKNYLIDVQGETECVVTLESCDEVSIEIHHHIPSLFILVKSVVNKHLEQNNSFCSFDICLEVMKLHYANLVGYVPLVKTIHEKFHNGFLNIPVKIVRGDYKMYLDDYSKYLDTDDLDIIDNRLHTVGSVESWTSCNYPGLEKVA